MQASAPCSLSSAALGAHLCGPATTRCSTKSFVDDDGRDDVSGDGGDVIRTATATATVTVTNSLGHSQLVTSTIA